MYTVLPWYKRFFCKHYYVVIEDKFTESGRRQLNTMGYNSMKSQCRLCGNTVEHD